MVRYLYGIGKVMSCVLWSLVWVVVWDADAAWADGFVPYEKVRMVRAKVTAYCAGACCCGRHADGVTSIGRDARLPGAAVAPDAIPYGHLLWIPGAGYRLADDTGGAMRTSWRVRREIHVDLRMASHADAKAWGVRELEIALYRPARAKAAEVDVELVSASGMRSGEGGLERQDLAGASGSASDADGSPRGPAVEPDCDAGLPGADEPADRPSPREEPRPVRAAAPAAVARRDVARDVRS